MPTKTKNTPVTLTTIETEAVYLESIEALVWLAHLVNDSKPKTPLERRVKEIVLRELGSWEYLPDGLSELDELLKVTPAEAGAAYSTLTDDLPCIADNSVEIYDGDIKVGCWHVSAGEAQRFFIAAGYYGGKKPKVGSDIPVSLGRSRKARVANATTLHFYADEYHEGEEDTDDTVEGVASFNDLFELADHLAARGLIRKKK